MKFGDFQIRTVSGGSFKLDGGAMFGVVPKPVWERATTPDARNRISLETNCLLIETETQKILVDTGYGSKLPEKRLEQIAGETGNPIVENLSQNGVTPEQIDLVIFSHLHFDHASGAVQYDGDNPRPVFANARHVVQQFEWQDATSLAPELTSTRGTPA